MNDEEKGQQTVLTPGKREGVHSVEAPDAAANRGEDATVEGDSVSPSTGNRVETVSPTVSSDRGSSGASVVGQSPTTVVQRTTVAGPFSGPATTAGAGAFATPSGGLANGSRGDIDTTAADSLSAANDRGSSRTSVVGERPTTVGQCPTVARSRKDLTSDGRTGRPPVVAETSTTAAVTRPVATPSGGVAVVAQQATTVTERVTVVRGDGRQTTVAVKATTASDGKILRGSPEVLRDRLRLALRRHIDPDDDTMPTLDGTGTFLWVPADDVLDGLVAAIGPEREALARLAAVADTPAGPDDEHLGEYGIGWDTAMDLIKNALKEGL